MKKFSTIALLLALSSSVFAADEMNAPQTQCAFLPNAPDQHLVVKGDTLWGISQMFLEHAWCWPQVWGMNREDIKNPHWIYPGQIVYFDRAAGRLRLGQPAGGGGSDTSPGNIPTVRLSPQIRGENLASNAITTIPSNVIEPFLSQPLILEENELKDTPRIVSAQQGHVNAGKSEKVYAMGDLHGGSFFQVYRPSTPLKDPETNKIIGYESAYLGTLKLTREGKTDNEAHTFLVTTSKEEMTVGDRLLPVPNSEMANYVPHPPSADVNARIVSIYGGVAQAGQNQTISINRGSKDGIDIGTVLQLYRLGDIIADKTKSKSVIKLPDEQYGTLFIYRVFKNISYGLIMQVTDSAQVGDIVRKPE
ncbi:LysM peptidoglycan-binding domain-containing protein [Solimicrobium silvestre]|uniref:LysM domain n=1 Tax=Solimicrobium silvestre TaxID=2099400 RepID=A0A2S9H3D8_9BURK|nr:LysM peptidoglycan-binding domain-containing protein [Solimicrobium silvestre]PRC94480.1 LysM domain [Solimicrobium silvestre]